MSIFCALNALGKTIVSKSKNDSTTLQHHLIVASPEMVEERCVKTGDFVTPSNLLMEREEAR